MESEDTCTKHGGRNRAVADNGPFGAIYGMSFIGAAFYFIGHASTFWLGVLGFLKAVFWPAVVMYAILDLLKL